MSKKHSSGFFRAYVVSAPEGPAVSRRAGSPLPGMHPRVIETSVADPRGADDAGGAICVEPRGGPPGGEESAARAR